jgi:predicted alpha/beta superfamily hydrolase
MEPFFKKTSLIICLGLISCTISAQVTIKINLMPGNTPPASKFYFAGNLNNWNPGDSSFTLKPGADGYPAIMLPEGKGTIQYKITRGSWDLVETGINGEEIGNRSFTFTGVPQTINLTLVKWKGAASATQSTASKNVSIMDTNYAMPQLSRNRRIWLYLPPDYQTSKKYYPVIYMQDGQNLFDKKTSFSGEWEVDETLNDLYAKGDYGVIVVGIDNGGNKRMDEYSPWKNGSYGGGEGDAYLDFIIKTLKPHIDSNYRTKKQPEYTCLFGSSMGALIATYGAEKFPSVFGKVGSFSPAYWVALPGLNTYIQNSTNNISNLRIIQVAGQKESPTMATHLQNITNLQLSKGLKSTNSKIKIDADGTHSESYWKREFGAAYQWLFANTKLPD